TERDAPGEPEGREGGGLACVEQSPNRDERVQESNLPYQRCRWIAGPGPAMPAMAATAPEAIVGDRPAPDQPYGRREIVTRLTADAHAPRLRFIARTRTMTRSPSP